MSFTPIDPSLPSGDLLSDAVTKINDGFADTLREVLLATVPGWNWSFEGADPAAPTAEVWTNGTKVLRAEHAYSSGRVSTTLYRYSTTGAGGPYTSKGTITYTYDGNGYLSSTAWSGVP